MQVKMQDGQASRLNLGMNLSVSFCISIGESFAELALIEKGQIRAHRRVHHSRDSLKLNLKQFLQTHSDLKPVQAFVSVRPSRKVIDAQLSESMAHIFTAGVENWLQISAQSQGKLTRDDQFIGLNERTLANGSIATPLTDEELHRVVLELKALKAQKVSLQLLHSGRNPTHLKKAWAHLTKEGFQVFIPSSLDGAQEIATWNRNILNANISGLIEDQFQEIQQELKETISVDNIHNLPSLKVDCSSAPQESLGALFLALELTARQNHHKMESFDLLYLGLEKFVFLVGSQTSSTWKSPWGDVFYPHQKSIELRLQPTQGIELNSFGRLDFSKIEEGWEPGPQFLGRGQKMTLLDLWAENTKFKKIAGLEDRVQPGGVLRFKNSLLALTKSSSTPQIDQVHLIKELQTLIFNRICLEAQFLRENKKLLVIGPLANVFANAFKKSLDTIVDTEDFQESLGLLQTQNLHGVLPS